MYVGSTSSMVEKLIWILEPCTATHYIVKQIYDQAFGSGSGDVKSTQWPTYFCTIIGTASSAKWQIITTHHMSALPVSHTKAKYSRLSHMQLLTIIHDIGKKLITHYLSLS